MISYLDNPATRALVLLNGLLVFAVTARLLLPDPALTSPAAETGKAGKPTEAVTAPASEPVTTASLEDYPSIVERPLFVEARRLPEFRTAEGSAPASVETSSLDGLSLAGVVLIGSRRIALVKASGASEALKVSEGDDLRGWRVLRVEPEALVIARNSEERRIAFPKPAQGVITVPPQNAAADTEPGVKPAP